MNYLIINNPCQLGKPDDNYYSSGFPSNNYQSRRLCRSTSVLTNSQFAWTWCKAKIIRENASEGYCAKDVQQQMYGTRLADWLSSLREEVCLHCTCTAHVVLFLCPTAVKQNGQPTSWFNNNIAPSHKWVPGFLLETPCTVTASLPTTAVLTVFSLPFALKLGQSICSSKYYPLSPVSWTVETQAPVRVMLMIQFFCYFLYCTERSSIREAMVESKLLRQGASVVWNMGW